MLTTGAPPNILIRANIYNNDPIRYIVLVVSCFVLPIPNIYRDTSVLIPVLKGWPSWRHNRLLCICTLHIHIALISTTAARGHARTRRRAAGRVAVAGSGRAAACRQAWTHAGWRTPQRPPRGARSGARRRAGNLQRLWEPAEDWPCGFPFPQLGIRNFGLVWTSSSRKCLWVGGL